MNSKIRKLLVSLETTKTNAEGIRAKLQTEYNKVFEDSKSLRKAINDSESASMYQLDRYGEIQSWFRFPELSELFDCREYFENWIGEKYFIQVDWENELLLRNEGDSITMQDDARRKSDNGVWSNHKMIIPETNYTDDDGQVDESKRNELIEAYMEKTGYYPGVFRVDYHGNVEFVNTQKKAAK